MKIKTNFKWDKDPRAELYWYGGSYSDSDVYGRPAVIILPGGGYRCIPKQEADPIARYYSNHGFSAFLFRYSTLYHSYRNKEHYPENENVRFPEPLEELESVFGFLRKNAQKYGIGKDIFLVGLSVGGHLAVNYANCWKELSGGDTSRKPRGCVLGYPVTDVSTSGKLLPVIFGHEAPFTREEIVMYNPVAHVSHDTCPMFIFHSATDSIIPADESLKFAMALAENSVPYELHVYKDGKHGYGLGDTDEDKKWPEQSLIFLKSHITR